MVDREQIKEEAREARDILDSPVFQKIIAGLREGLTNALMAESTQPRQLQLVAELKALTAIEVQLKVRINNEKFAAKGK